MSQAGKKETNALAHRCSQLDTVAMDWTDTLVQAIRRAAPLSHSAYLGLQSELTAVAVNSAISYRCIQI